MSDCIYRDCETCGKLVNHKNVHAGTKLKFETFSEYAEIFYYKVAGYYKNNISVINFIDCLSCSGLYYDKKNKEFIEGTAIKILDLIPIIANKFPHIKFNIYFNDYNPQYVKCLKCILSRKTMPKNVFVHIYGLDKNVFIDEISDKGFIRSYKAQNLIIYDPYDVDFSWSYLDKILKLKGDLILTHFYPIDIKRNMTNKISAEVIKKYENSYLMPFDEITAITKEKTVEEKNDFFRNRLREILLLRSNKKYFAYLPVLIHYDSLHLYDITCLSSSAHAIGLIKDTMYSLYTKNKNTSTITHSQISFFGDDKTNDYVDARQSGVSEYCFHYDIQHLTKMFCEEFKGKEIDKLIREHPYFPEKAVKVIQKKWRCTREKKGETTILKFPERSLYEQD